MTDKAKRVILQSFGYVDSFIAGVPIMDRNRLPDSGITTPDSMLHETPVEVQTGSQRPKRKRMTPEEREARKKQLKDEPKDIKFVRLARQRGVKAVKALRQFQHLANRSQYGWTVEQADKLIRSLQNEVDAIKARFAGSKTNGVTFNL